MLTRVKGLSKTTSLSSQGKSKIAYILLSPNPPCGFTLIWCCCTDSCIGRVMTHCLTHFDPTISTQLISGQVGQLPIYWFSPFGPPKILPNRHFLPLLLVNNFQIFSGIVCICFTRDEVVLKQQFSLKKMPSFWQVFVVTFFNKGIWTKWRNKYYLCGVSFTELVVWLLQFSLNLFLFKSMLWF